jgi:hypothetical protein
VERERGRERGREKEREKERVRDQLLSNHINFNEYTDHPATLQCHLCIGAGSSVGPSLIKLCALVEQPSPAFAYHNK